MSFSKSIYYLLLIGCGGLLIFSCIYSLGSLQSKVPFAKTNSAHSPGSEELARRTQQTQPLGSRQSEVPLTKTYSTQSRVSEEPARRTQQTHPLGGYVRQYPSHPQSSWNRTQSTALRGFSSKPIPFKRPIVKIPQAPISRTNAAPSRPATPPANPGAFLHNLILNPVRPSCKRPGRVPQVDPWEPTVQVCLDSLHVPCNVFSIGINYQWDFDDWALQTGCRVWSFDPSLHKCKFRNMTRNCIPSRTIPVTRIEQCGPEDCKRGPLHEFQKVGIADTDGVNSGASTLFWRPTVGQQTQYDVRTLKTLMNDKGVRRLDIVRMDVEGAEWGVLAQWSRDNMFEHIGQLLLEIHMYERGKSAGGVRRWSEVLNAIPMKLFHSARNTHDATTVYASLFAVYEVGFTHGRRLSQQKFSDFNDGKDLSDILEDVYQNGNTFTA